MPHFVIEHSSPLPGTNDWTKVFEKLATATAETGIIDFANIKLRAIPFEAFQLCDGSKSFVHLSVFLLDGRTPDQKETISLICRQTLAELLLDVDAISVDIRDMDSHAYKKQVRTRN